MAIAKALNDGEVSDVFRTLSNIYGGAFLRN